MEENRLEIRKRATHERIKQAAHDLILESGLEGFNLESAADMADVSRATLFNHFHSKEALVREVVTPLFSRTMERLAALLVRESALEMKDVADYCMDLWKDHCERIGFMGDVADAGTYPSLAGLHGEFKSGFTRLMERVGEGARLRGGDPALCAELILGCFVPILSAMGNRPDAQQIFSECLAGLALEDARLRE